MSRQKGPHATACGPFIVSKNWLADSKWHKCGVRRRIGKPLDRVSHDATAHRAVASPFLILMKAKDFASCGTRQGLRPLTPPPFRKRRAKTFCALFFAKRLFWQSEEKTVLKNTVFSFAQSVWFSAGFERTKRTDSNVKFSDEGQRSKLQRRYNRTLELGKVY